MSPRFHDDDSARIPVDASRGFSAAVSGGVAFGTAFVPGCVEDRGSRLRLRIALPDGGSVKADGRVRRLCGNTIPPGCDVSWEAVSTKSVDAVRKWLGRRA